MKADIQITVRKTPRRGKSRQRWRWTMKSKNGRIVGASTEAYVNLSACLDNLSLVTGIMMDETLIEVVSERTDYMVLTRVYADGKIHEGVSKL